jgi:hypothetical protein
MVDKIVDEHGEEAIAKIATAYREGATDAEALEAGTGVAAADLYQAFYADFGTDAPRPVTPAPLGDSDVALPGGGLPSPEPGVPDDGNGAERPDGAPAESGSPVTPLLIGAGALILGIALAAVIVVSRRRRPPPDEPGSIA